MLSSREGVIGLWHYPRASHLSERSAVATQPAGMGEMSSMMSMRTSKADVEPRPKDFPLHVRVRALVADWAVPREELKDFLIVGAPAAPERRAADPGVLESGVATQPEAPLDSRLVVRVLEHMLQETLADEELIDAVGKMVLQEDPYFLQFEDSPPPGAFDDHTLPREPEPFVAATARAERSSRVPVPLADECGGALDVPVCGTRDVAPLRRDPEPGTNDVASVHLPEPAVLPLSSAGAASMNTGGTGSLGKLRARVFSQGKRTSRRLGCVTVEANSRVKPLPIFRLFRSRTDVTAELAKCGTIGASFSNASRCCGQARAQATCHLSQRARTCRSVRLDVKDSRHHLRDAPRASSDRVSSCKSTCQSAQTCR